MSIDTIKGVFYFRVEAARKSASIKGHFSVPIIACSSIASLCLFIYQVAESSDLSIKEWEEVNSMLGYGASAIAPYANNKIIKSLQNDIRKLRMQCRRKIS